MAYPRQSIELSGREFAELTQALVRAPTESGETVRRFESAFAEFVGARHAISFASQRAGMQAVLKALNFQQGDEVIVPAYTFFSVPACVVLAGLTPVFCDVSPPTWNLNPDEVKRTITPRTRALIVTHLNGCPADLESLVEITRKAGIILIEDCAQALGATYRSKQVGSFGVGCYSFGEGKNLLGLGGGMVTTDDDALAARLRQFSESLSHPSLGQILMKALRLLTLNLLTQPPIFSFTAYPWLYLASMQNGKVDTDKAHVLRFISPLTRQRKMCNAQAALGLAQLSELTRRNQKRRENAFSLAEALQGLPGIELPPNPHDRTHLYMHYAVRIKERDRFCRTLVQRGVDAQRDYCSFCPKLPDFQPNRWKTPVAQRLDGTLAYLPTQPQLGKKEMQRIAQNVKEVLAL